MEKGTKTREGSIRPQVISNSRFEVKVVWLRYQTRRQWYDKNHADRFNGWLVKFYDGNGSSYKYRSILTTSC